MSNLEIKGDPNMAHHEVELQGERWDEEKINPSEELTKEEIDAAMEEQRAWDVFCGFRDPQVRNRLSWEQLREIEGLVELELQKRE